MDNKIMVNNFIAASITTAVFVTAYSCFVLAVMPY